MWTLALSKYTMLIDYEDLFRLGRFVLQKKFNANPAHTYRDMTPNQRAGSHVTWEPTHIYGVGTRLHLKHIKCLFHINEHAYADFSNGEDMIIPPGIIRRTFGPVIRGLNSTLCTDRLWLKTHMGWLTALEVSIMSLYISISIYNI